MAEQQYKEFIYKKASEVKTKEDFNKLFDEILEYDHDYGSIVYGCMAAMKGAFNAVNRDERSGGITGFQAGIIGWQCVAEFMHIKGSARILDYDDLLFPQYAHKFEKTISKSIWEETQNKAKENLAKDFGHPSVRAHWQSIVDGNIPFGFAIKD